MPVGRDVLRLPPGLLDRSTLHTLRRHAYLRRPTYRLFWGRFLKGDISTNTSALELTRLPVPEPFADLLLH